MIIRPRKPLDFRDLTRDGEENMIYHVYGSSYMGEYGGDGIYFMELNTDETTLRMITSYPESSDQPSFLSVSRKYVYAVSERAQGGAVTAFRKDPDSGELTKINRIETEGTAMCHLCLWKDGHFLSAANYMDGSLLVCRTGEGGRLDRISDFKRHKGIGFESVLRQEGPHVHSTQVSADGRRLYAADLGLDQIFCYRILAGGRLEQGTQDMQIHTPGGMGPRHFVFSKDDRFLYVVAEMGNRIFAYRTDDGGITYQEIQNLSTLPEGFSGSNIAADIHLSPDGQFLYASNRGANNIAAFAVSEETGVMRVLGHYGCHGEYPRNFCVTADGCFLLIANQKSGNIILCERNIKTGEIGGKLAEVPVPQAVYVRAIEKERI